MPCILTMGEDGNLHQVLLTYADSPMLSMVSSVIDQPDAKLLELS